MSSIIVIGAGFGGLTTAAELARSGKNVVLLESHTYPGGCAGTFFYQNYRFDAGATLAGGFAPGMPMDILAQRFNLDWQSKPAETAMTVHLPGQPPMPIWTDRDRWRAERVDFFGESAEKFWDWQETTAETMWKFAMQTPSWPPNDFRSLTRLAVQALSTIGWNPSLYMDGFRNTSFQINRVSDCLRLFLDGQLLISAQTTSASANALFAATALDLPFRGVVHTQGGMGGMADKLSRYIQQMGGKVFYRQHVVSVRRHKDGVYVVKSRSGDQFSAEATVFNLPPWNISAILGEDAPASLSRNTKDAPTGWGAFTIYLGIDQDQLPEGIGLHHQVLSESTLSEGNSIFLSLSPTWDEARAPTGKRAITISTHTKLQSWWDHFEHDQTAYEEKKEIYTKKVIGLASQLIPDLARRAELILPGTPVTFQRFTHRHQGWVGGFPQTNLFRTWKPRLGKNLWMVGDSIFPGQSVPAVCMGGLRVAREVLACV